MPQLEKLCEIAKLADEMFLDEHKRYLDTLEELNHLKAERSK